MYAENELLFPSSVIPKLGTSRGEAWRKLVDHVSGLPEDHPESLAFSLMMMRLDICLECETDSYRAMRGCAACAIQTLRRYKGPDSELLQKYKAALKDVEAHLAAVPVVQLDLPLVQARAA
jgi:hypothetical protein